MQGMISSQHNSITGAPPGVEVYFLTCVLDLPSTVVTRSRRTAVPNWSTSSAPIKLSPPSITVTAKLSIRTNLSDA